MRVLWMLVALTGCEEKAEPLTLELYAQLYSEAVCSAWCDTGQDAALCLAELEAAVVSDCGDFDQQAALTCVAALQIVDLCEEQSVSEVLQVETCRNACSWQ